LEGLNDGHTLLLAHAAVDDDTLFLWDARNGIPGLRVEPDPLHPGTSLAGAATTIDRRFIAAVLVRTEGAMRYDEVVVHDANAQVDVGRISDLSKVNTIRFSPDGHYLAIATANEVVVVETSNLAARQKVAKISAQAALAFSPDSTRLAIGAEDQILTVLSLRDGNPVAALVGHESSILAVQWTADGRTVITGGLDGTCRIWDPHQYASKGVLPGFWSKELGSAIINAGGSLVAPPTTLAICGCLRRRH